MARHSIPYAVFFNDEARLIRISDSFRGGFEQTKIDHSPRVNGQYGVRGGRAHYELGKALGQGLLLFIGQSFKVCAESHRTFVGGRLGPFQDPAAQDFSRQPPGCPRAPRLGAKIGDERCDTIWKRLVFDQADRGSGELPQIGPPLSQHAHATSRPSRNRRETGDHGA